MAFVAIPKTTTGRRGTDITNESRMTLVKGGRGGAELAIQIMVSRDAMTRMRWLIGDGLQVAFDDQNPLLVLLKRVNKGGRAISSSTKAPQGTPNQRGVLKVSMPTHFPFKHRDSFVCTVPVEDQGGLVLTFSE